MVTSSKKLSKTGIKKAVNISTKTIRKRVSQGDDVSYNSIPCDLFYRKPVLCLDLASLSGYCVGVLGEDLENVHLGLIGKKTGISINTKLNIFYDKVVSLIKNHNISLICYERVPAPFQKASWAIYNKILGVLQLISSQLNIKVAYIDVNTIKLKFTGYGHANKDLMRTTLKLKSGFDLKEDNMVDAFAIFYVLSDKINNEVKNGK